MTRKTRLAVVVTHPIQYFTPFYRALHADGSVDLRVFFCSRIGLDLTRDELMGVDVAWATDLLEGYPHEFLPGAKRITSVGFRAVDNPGIGAALSRFGPDVVLLHGYGQKTLWRAIYWAWRRRIPLIQLSDRTAFGRGSARRRALRRWVLPWINRRFRATLSMSDASDAYHKSHGVPGNALFRFPNMLDAQFWAATDRRGDLRRDTRAALGLHDETFVFLAVSKLVDTKRLDDIVQASTTLAARGLDVHVLIAGDGAERAAIEAQIRTSKAPVTLLGFQNLDTLPQYYCAADCFVHAAEVENFGMVVLEATVFGLPLVLSNRMGAIGPTSPAREGENALVFPSGDVEALTTAMARLAEDPARGAEMGKRSREIAKEHRGPKTVAAVLAAIDHVLGASR